MELIFNVLFFFALLLIPESPRYLVAAGKKEKALGVLKRLMGNHADAKYKEISETIATDHRPSLKDLLDPKGKIRPIVWLGIGLAAFQQFTGINIIFYYGAVLWQSAGFTEQHSLLINVISSALSIVACFIATFSIDRIGRKPMLLIGSIGMAVTLGVMSIIFWTSAQAAGGSLTLKGIAGPIALVAGNLFVMFFNFSWVLSCGYAWRDVPQSNAWKRPCGQRTVSVGGQLCDHNDLPDHALRNRPWSIIRYLCCLCSHLVHLCFKACT